MVGSCWLIKTFVEDITMDLTHFNSNGRSINQNEIVAHFCELVQSFLVVKQLSESQIYSIFAERNDGSTVCRQRAFKI